MATTTNRIHRLLVIDPGESTGYASFETVNDITTLLNYGDYHIDGDSGGSQCISMKNKVLELIITHTPNHVVVEDFFFRSARANGSIMNAALRAASWMACVESEVTYTTISPLKWKIGITGRCKANSIEKNKWGVLAEKVRVQDALWTSYGIRFANHSLSYKTNKAVKLRYDAIDAVAIGIDYIRREFAIQKIKSTSLNSDHENVISVYTYM